MKTYIKPSTEIVATNLTTDCMQLGFSNDTGDAAEDGNWKSPSRKDQNIEEDEDYGW